MVSPTNNLSALSEKIIKRFKLVASHPETDELDYTSLIHMDPAKICADIQLGHSKNLHWYVTKVHTYKNPQVRVLALVIAEYFNPEKGYSYPPQSLLSALLGINRQTISKLTKELEATGYWKITRGYADVSTRYTLTPVEFSRLRDFLVAERTPNKSYLDGATFPRVSVNEARSRTNLKRTARAAESETDAETLADPFEPKPMPDWPGPDDAEQAAPVVVPDESSLSAETETVPVIADVTAPETVHTPQPPVLRVDPEPATNAPSITDDEIASIIDSFIEIGLCLDENIATNKIRTSLRIESAADRTLSPADLTEIAREKLIAGIAGKNGKNWTHYVPSRMNDILASQKESQQDLDPFAIPATDQ